MAMNKWWMLGIALSHLHLTIYVRMVTKKNMTGHDSNVCSGSHTYELKLVKIEGHPQGTAQRAAPPGGRRRRRQRTAFQVSISWVPSSGGSWVFRQNGKTWRYEGCMSLNEVCWDWMQTRA